MHPFRLMAGVSLAVAVVAASSQAAQAVTSLKQVQISNGSQIDLLFDGKVQKGQIRTEFFNDIIQLSISDVSVYPAKISSVNGSSLTKIFAYQYAPKLVRCRLTVKGKAEDYKDRFAVHSSGKILTMRVDEAASRVARAAAAPHAPGPDAEERALLNRVLAADAQAAAAEKRGPAAEGLRKDTITTSTSAPVAAAHAKPSSESLPVHVSGNPKLGGAKPLPSPFKAFGKMAAVLAIFGVFALLLKRFAQGRAEARIGGRMEAGEGGSGLLGSLGGVLGRMARKGLGRGGKMIEVLSTHYLGPKKSIAVVRVAGRVLVIGVTNDAINLITQLSGDEAADPMGAMDGLDLGSFLGPNASVPPAKAQAPKAPTGPMSGADPLFADLLQSETGKPSFARGAGAYAAASPVPVAPHAGAGAQAGREPVIPGASQNSLSSVRAQIRNRLEGLKPL